MKMMKAENNEINEKCLGDNWGEDAQTPWGEGPELQWPFVEYKNDHS